MGIIYSPEGYSLEANKYNYLDNCEEIKAFQTRIEQTGMLFDTKNDYTEQQRLEDILLTL